jgi:hypothetical protein
MIQGIFEFFWDLCSPRGDYYSANDARTDVTQSIFIFLGWAVLALLIFGALYMFVPGFHTTLFHKHF